ncbi:hypothetical protein [uncultured Kordia sp.]|uniref:hypothetical protein n=1 Tax=uncultured Kordia sp. TaxID=507699 RepID=UPI002627677B|nr:hypothetical protein [uncultured Kordia sp.]
MKTIKLIALILSISFSLTGCFGDKNIAVGTELGDTNFVNTNFIKNKIEFSALPKNLCTYINNDKVKELYPDASKILTDDGKTFMSKSCRFLVYIGDGDFNYLTGTIFASEDQLAEGEKWEETWELKKKMSKSSEYVSNLGKAAIWKAKKRELSIKMDGYSVVITAPGSVFKEEEVAKNRDYKKIAIAIAESTNLF